MTAARYVQLERLDDGNAVDAHAAVVTCQPYAVWRYGMAQEGDHRVVRSLRTGRILGLVTGYRGNADERSFRLAVIKSPRATAAYWEGVATYLDLLFVERGARRAYLEGHDEATRQWLHGARRMFPTLYQDHRGDAWILTRTAWLRSPYSQGKWRNQPMEEPSETKD